MSSANFVDLIGQKFGKRIVIGREETPVYNGKKGSSRWTVQCVCGSIKSVYTSGLKKSTSCGCDKEYAVRSGNSRRSPVPKKLRENKSHLKRTFGLTVEQRDSIARDQENCCAVCKIPFTSTPHVDHDHSCCPGKTSCGKCIRGLLCHHCNTALGNMQDSIERLESAIIYLKEHKSNP